MDLPRCHGQGLRHNHHLLYVESDLAIEAIRSFRRTVKWSHVDAWVDMLKNPTKCLWDGNKTVCRSYFLYRRHIHI